MDVIPGRYRCCFPKCSEPQWGWTNYMEPLCKRHFFERRFIQDLMIALSGFGSWGALVRSFNPEIFNNYLFRDSR